MSEIADVVVARAKAGKNFGTVLVAEGLLAAIPEFNTLIKEIFNIVVKRIRLREPAIFGLSMKIDGDEVFLSMQQPVKAYTRALLDTQSSAQCMVVAYGMGGTGRCAHTHGR